MLLFFENKGLQVLRMLTDHTKTKVKGPQTNGIPELFHKTMLNEFYRVALHKKIYRSIEELRKDLDHWMERYNNEREPREALSGPDSDGDVPGEH